MIQPSPDAVVTCVVEAATVVGAVDLVLAAVVETGALAGADCAALPAQPLNIIPKPLNSIAI